MTVEEKLQALQNQVDALSNQLSAQAARDEVQNLMSRYQYLHAAHMDDRILSEFWADDPDIHMEEGPYGVYLYDRNGVRDYYTQKYQMDRPPMPGRLTLSSIATPVIEIAGDGRTAQGLWMAFGTESGAYPEGTVSGIPSVDNSQPDKYGNRVLAHWVWQKYRADFVRKEGKWKILHLHIYELIRCPFNENWVTYSMERPKDQAALDSEMRLCMAGITPEQPTTFHWQYSPFSVPVLEPVPPEPYDTLSPNNIC